MANPLTVWRPDRHPLHALLQLLDALVVGLARARRATNDLARPETAEEHQWWIGENKAIWDGYRDLVCRFVRADLSPHQAAAGFADAAVADVARQGRLDGDAEAVVRRVQQLLVSLGWHNFGLNFPLSPLGGSGDIVARWEQILVGDYIEARRDLLALLARLGEQLPAAVRGRMNEVAIAAAAPESLTGWVDAARRALDAPADHSGEVTAEGGTGSAEGQAPAAAPRDAYTMSDIAAFLMVRRVNAANAARRAALPPARTVSEGMNRVYESAMNAPPPCRLDDETAAVLPVYRRLMREARTVYQMPLDEESLRMVVADIADRAGRPREQLMALAVDEFGRVWDSTLPPAPTAPAAEPAPAVEAIVQAPPAVAPSLDELPPSRQKAWGWYLHATRVENALGDEPTDQAVYGWLEEHIEEVLPKFETFARYLSECRNHLDQKKNTPRAGREPGRSVVREGER